MANIVSQFTSSIRTGVSPLTVNFTNTSTGPYTSVKWDFGDGSQSSQIHPSHQFTSDGTFRVTLTVYDEKDGKDQAQSSIVVFTNDDYSTSSTTQQALFTSKRFTTGQVAVRKTLVDGSTVATEFPLSSTTGDFNTGLAGGLVYPATATGATTTTFSYSTATYPNLTSYFNAGWDAYFSFFMKTGSTATRACGGHQQFTYKVTAIDTNEFTTDREIPSITSTSGMAGMFIFSSGGTSTGNTFDTGAVYKSLRASPAVDGLETLNIPGMYEPDAKAAGLLKYFENNSSGGTSKLYIQPTFSGWNTIEMWKPSTVRLTLPYVMWHNKVTSGVSLIDSTVTYRDALTNLQYSNLTIEDEGSIVGRVFHEKKIIVIDDQELQASLNYLANRSYTLPAPSVSTTSIADSTGGLQSGVTYYVTYRVRDASTSAYSGGSVFGVGLVQPLHCRYIKEIQPVVSGNKLRIQAPASLWYTANRGTANDSGFTATVVDVLIGSGSTGTSISAATWYYSGASGTYAQLNAGMDITYSSGTKSAATFTDLTISGTSDLTFGNDPTIFGYFSATAQSTIYKMSATCVAKNNEFNATQNDTFDGTLNESVYISEVALYNENNELLMTGKLNTPIEKNDTKFVTIKLDLDL